MNAESATTSASPAHLRCEFLENPLGIDERQPRLSWHVSDPRRGAVQTAWQIIAATAPEKLNDASDLWDSGKTMGDENWALYAGPVLLSHHRVYWKVRTWDKDGQPSPWSEPAWFETGLLEQGEWLARWIGKAPPGREDSQPCPFLRKEFSIEKPVARARIYVTAKGLYELYLNGKRVGKDCFVPGWTDYRKRLQYLTYDVTELLAQGQNVLGAILGDGWFCGYLGFKDNRCHYGGHPSLLLQMALDFSGGSRQLIVSDASWKTAFGPLLKSDIYNGETYDARREMPGWAEPAFDGQEWKPAEVFKADKAILEAKRCQPVRKIQEIQTVEMTEPRPGVHIFDLGQNIVGWIRLKIRGPAGTKITIRHGEMLQADGTLYTENLRAAKAADEYILKGDEEEVYEPRFTFHGFRYAELTGCPEPPEKTDVTGVVLHSDAPPAGTFECSHPLVNQLQSNIRWGQKGNFLEVPTDCPQRDERLGWTGDAQVFIRTACFNLDVSAFFVKWFGDLADSQAKDGCVPHVAPNLFDKWEHGFAAWADAIVICPWAHYLSYGDRRVLDRMFEPMAKWVNWQKGPKGSKNLVRNNWGFGDWLAIDAPDTNSGYPTTPHNLIGTAYFARTARLLSRMAAILGREKERKKYEALHKRVKRTFQREFITPAGRMVGDTQTAYLLALAFDLAPEKLRENMLQRLIDNIEGRGWKLSTGFVGTPLLCPVLTRFGRADVAFRLLFQEEYPSWLYTVKQGATTMWERWNSWTREKGFGEAGMNSFNHYAYGSIGEWLYETAGGIGADPERPGYKHIVMKPEPGRGLGCAKAELLSPHGLVKSEWKAADGRFQWDVTIPANTTATVYLPAGNREAATENGKKLAAAEGIEILDTKNGKTVCRIGAGRYAFGMPFTPA